MRLAFPDALLAHLIRLSRYRPYFGDGDYEVVRCRCAAFDRRMQQARREEEKKQQEEAEKLEKAKRYWNRCTLCREEFYTANQRANVCENHEKKMLPLVLPSGRPPSYRGAGKAKSDPFLVAEIEDRVYTFEEIGQMLNITRERVRQIEDYALLKLRGPLRRALAAFDDNPLRPDHWPQPTTFEAAAVQSVTDWELIPAPLGWIQSSRKFMQRWKASVAFQKQTQDRADAQEAKWDF